MPPDQPAGHGGGRLLILVAIVALLVVGAASLSPGHLDGVQWARIGSGLVVLVLAATRLAASPRALSGMAGQISIWLLLGVLLVAGYSYRQDLAGIFGRVAGTAIPGRGVVLGSGAVRYTAEEGGQFFVSGVVNGVSIRFLVDTGASGIALTRHDAERLGLDPDRLDYSSRFSTANGSVRAAPITINALQIGPLDARAIAAWVNEGDLEDSLLGMNFLSTLGRVEIRGDTLTLER